MRRRIWTEDEDRLLDELYTSTDTSQLAEMLGRTKQSVQARAQILCLRKSDRIYALYKGEELKLVGSREEIMEFAGIKLDTFHFYKTEVNKNRTNRRGTFVEVVE